MNDDSMVKIMQALDLDYSKAIFSTMHFGQSIENLNKQLAGMKSIAMQSVKDINTTFSSQLGQISNNTMIVDQFGKPFKTIRDEAKATALTVNDIAKSIKESSLVQMQAQAASVQQRVTTKGLSQEYAKQASSLREQLSVIQTRLQSEGKLTAEEVKQTQQLKEQLEILRAQTRTAISDDIRENPSTFGDEWQRRSSWFLSGAMFYGTINAAKEATQTIKEVEMGMVEVARVMTDSSFVFHEYRDNLFKLGIDYGQTFENVQQIALRWAQSGYNVADSLELTETSLLALNTAELDATQATEAMIGIMAQWQLQAEDMALVMDKINITADRHSVTSQDLVDGLLRSSGAARVMNLSLEETLGLLTVMREASGRTGQEVGNALNSILSYIQRPRSIDVLEDLGINVFADEAKTQFRNVLDIFKDIASNWNTLSTEIQDGFVQSANDAELFNEELANALGMQEEWNDLQQRDISQAAAGVYRRNYFIGMIERLANVQGVLNNMMDAEGYSMRENAATMDTLEKKQQSLKASAEALAVAMGDAGFGGSLKAIADGGTSALNAINQLPKPMKDLLMATTSTFLAVKTLQLGMKTFGLELPGISQMIASLTSGTWSLTAALKAGGAGLATFASANAPLLALSAAVGIIVAITSAEKKRREEREKYIQVARESIQSLEEEKIGLEKLAREYETLKARSNELTATADEKERLRDVQRELVDLYDVSISGIDAEGRAYADSTEDIKHRIETLEALSAIEKETLENAVRAREADTVSMLKKNLPKREEIAEEIKMLQEQKKEYERIFNTGETLNVSTPYGGFVLDGSTEHGRKLLTDYINNISRDIVDLTAKNDEINNTIAEGTADRIQVLNNSAVETINQLSENGTNVSDAGKRFALEVAKAFSLDTRDIKLFEDDFKNTIVEFMTLIGQFEAAMAKGDKSAIDTAKKAITELLNTLIETYPQLEEAKFIIDKIFEGKTDDLAQSFDNLANSTEKLTKKFNDATDKLTRYYQILNEVNSKEGLSAQSKRDIISTYHELLPYLTDEQELRKQLISIISKEEEAQRDAYTKMLMYSEEFFSAKIKGNSILVDRLGEFYTKDLENAKSLAMAKEIVENELIKNLSGKWAKYYGAVTSGHDQITKDNLTRAAMAGSREAEDTLKAIKAYEDVQKRFEGIANEVGGVDFKGINTSGIKDPKSSKSKYENKQLAEALKLLEHRKKISEETQDSIKTEIAELNRINNLYAKTADERMNMAERIYAAEKKLKDRTLQDSVHWINERKNLNELSAKEEIQAWERVKNNQADNIEAVKQATLNLYKLKNQLLAENYNKEETAIKHLTKLGILSVEQQIAKYRELYEVKAQSLAEEQSRVENLFNLYSNLIKEQQKKTKDAYDERIKQIESEAKVKKEVQDDIIKGIEKELELLNRQEQEYDHDKKMADLKEQLAYWQVRTSEDARKKVAELLKQIDEEEHKREVDLKRQTLEDKKKVLQDEVQAIDDTAKDEREKLEKSYKRIEVAFDDHSTNIVALASTMSKEAYEQWLNNYIIPLQNALANNDYGMANWIFGDLNDFVDDMGSYINDYSNKHNGSSSNNTSGNQSSSNNAQIYSIASTIAELKKQYALGNNPDAPRYTAPLYEELSKLNPTISDYLRNNDYMKAAEYVSKLPKMHSGGKTLSYGAVYMKPGELVFPPDLSTKLESLIEVIYQRPMQATTPSSFADNRKEVKIDKLLNIERNYIEDEVDGDILARQLARQITSIF